MKNLLILGAGKIGSMIAALLSETKEYKVIVADRDLSSPAFERLKQHLSNFKIQTLDVTDEKALAQCITDNKIHGVISSLPFYCNEQVAKVCVNTKVYYFDLTEDVHVTKAIKKLSKNASSCLVPQCGLAPGFIGILANHLMKKFHVLDTVKMRVGALPVNSSNALNYALTWSTEGLINEYCNLCHGIVGGKSKLLHPLEGIETINIDGITYEAFNTSGGLGALTQLYEDNVRQMNYKTIRYPGHRDKVKFLLQDLRLNENRELLKQILEKAIPTTYQDVVVIYVSVSGKQNGSFLEENYVNKIYPQEFCNLSWSAIQVSTASGLCAVVDEIMQNEGKYQGFVHQENLNFNQIINNRFGRLFKET